MTPEEKADELINNFEQKKIDSENGFFSKNEAENYSILLCDEVVLALNSVKGMGKIHKVKYWKKVKEILESKKM